MRRANKVYVKKKSMRVIVYMQNFVRKIVEKQVGNVNMTIQWKSENGWLLSWIYKKKNL